MESYGSKKINLTLRNRKLIGWKIFYGDGNVISSKTSTWTQAPQKNVQVVKLFYEGDNGLEIGVHHNQEYYILDDLLELPKEIKIGKAIEGKKYYAIREKALKDNEIVRTLI